MLLAPDRVEAKANNVVQLIDNAVEGSAAVVAQIAADPAPSSRSRLGEAVRQQLHVQEGCEGARDAIVSACLSAQVRTQPSNRTW